MKEEKERSEGVEVEATRRKKEGRSIKDQVGSVIVRKEKEEVRRKWTLTPSIKSLLTGRKITLVDFMKGRLNRGSERGL